MSPTERPTPPSIRVTVNVKWKDVAKYVGGPLLAALGSIVIARVQHNAGQDEAKKEVTSAYRTLAAPTNEHAEEIAKLQESVATLAKTVELQGRLLLAGREGFTPTGTVAPPTTSPRRKRKVMPPPADPALIKKVQDDAAKTLKAVKESVAEAPTLAPVPPLIPKEPPPIELPKPSP